MSSTHTVEIEERMLHKNLRQVASYEIRVTWGSDTDRDAVVEMFDAYAAEIRAQIGGQP